MNSMRFKINRYEAFKIFKAVIYVSVSAGLDYLISITTGSQFGVFTAPINILLVSLRQFIKSGYHK